MTFDQVVIDRQNEFMSSSEPTAELNAVDSFVFDVVFELLRSSYRNIDEINQNI